MLFFFFFFKQKTAYEMRISDWSSDVCSSDLAAAGHGGGQGEGEQRTGGMGHRGLRNGRGNANPEPHRSLRRRHGPKVIGERTRSRPGRSSDRLRRRRRRERD